MMTTARTSPVVPHVEVRRPTRRDGRHAVLAAVLVLGWPPAVARATIVAALEEPAPGATAASIGNVRGWAFDDSGANILSPLQVSFDGAPSIEVPCCSSRADVQAEHPAAPPRSGFSGVFNWALLEPGSHEIVVRVNSANGGTRDLRAGFSTARVDGFAFLANLDIDNQLEGNCVNLEAEICCDGILAVPSAGPGASARTCHDVCWSWSTAAQGLTMTRATCE